jgi:hypothetical protein
MVAQKGYDTMRVFFWFSHECRIADKQYIVKLNADSKEFNLTMYSLHVSLRPSKKQSSSGWPEHFWCLAVASHERCTDLSQSELSSPAQKELKGHMGSAARCRSSLTLAENTP